MPGHVTLNLDDINLSIRFTDMLNEAVPSLRFAEAGSWTRGFRSFSYKCNHVSKIFSIDVQHRYNKEKLRCSLCILIMIKYLISVFNLYWWSYLIIAIAVQKSLVETKQNIAIEQRMLLRKLMYKTVIWDQLFNAQTRFKTKR